MSALEILCFSGVSLTAFIFVKLHKMNKTTTFINRMYAILFLCNAFISFTICYFLFRIGDNNLSGKIQPSSEPSTDLHFFCRFYVLTWLSSQTFLIIGNIGIMFCRFIYTRYAIGLVSEGTSLFHRLVGVVTISFMFQCLFLYPFSGLWRFYNIYPLNTIKGNFCALVPMDQEDFQDEEGGFAWKHKLIAMALLLLFVLVTLYFYKSSKNQEKKHSVPKYQQNLMVISHHTIYTLTILLGIMADQLGNSVLEFFYTDLGPQLAFVIWWIAHVIYFIIIHVFCPLIILAYASTRLETFNGLNSKPFPGQECPRPLPILQPKIHTHTARHATSSANPLLVVSFHQ